MACDSDQIVEEDLSPMNKCEGNHVNDSIVLPVSSTITTWKVATDTGEQGLMGSTSLYLMKKCRVGRCD